ncbi:unnamed protein product [Eruca vesicaria subsp. sativa]|uniref:Translation elongation factor EF1B beta/delta subunit guanine nucleotide exchange domain-containing protein n=1 Tax=Eruca vesicaria subsp. sativa TaxID=29727 RepID=A0ABC8L4W6_ERUVS|nr:unnamed protein product [Eruca vesicaria subsp. sativa]
MAAAFPNLNSNAGLKKLDEHLLTRYYITSHKASKDDITVYVALSKPPPSKYVNASRWYNHIETLLSISGISSEGSGVTIDGLVFNREVGNGNTDDTKDGVVVIDDNDNVQDVDLIEKEAEERPSSLIASTKRKYVSFGLKTLRLYILTTYMGLFLWIAWESIAIVVMPKDDETDMYKLEEHLRSIQMEGLVWGASKLVPVGCGIKLLGIEYTTLGQFADLGRIKFSTIVKEQITENRYVKSCQILRLNRICKYPKSILKLLEAAWPACQSGLVLRQLFGDKPDIEKLEKSVRSVQTEGVVWSESTIIKLGYGFKYLRILFTIVDDFVCFKTVLQKTGGIQLKRICKYLKSILLTPQKL